MREPDFYRYFLGCRPDPHLRDALAALGGQAGQRVRGELLHLTLCVIAEATGRERFLLPRVRAALAGQALSAFPVRLGRVRGGPHGAAVRTIGRQDEIQDFYRTLVRLLARRGIAPLHRKSGLHPHVTLGYRACRFEPYTIAADWLVGEFLLVESEVGLSRHHVLGRWRLQTPRQGFLPLDSPAPELRRAS